MRARRFSGLVLAVTLIAITARAQTGATETAQPPDAERYVVEGSALLWFPTVAMQMSSDAPGVAGTTVDAVRELGVANRAFTQLGVVARLGRRHKIRFQLYPISYQSSATVARPITFSGATYPSGSSVKTTVDWTAYRIGYEWDAIAKPTWYLGLIGELKQTDIRVRLTGSGAAQTRRTQVPVPAIGPVARVYITPRLSLTGEITGMAVPDSADRHYGGHYIDGDLYAMFTFRRHVAAQAGFRSLDLRHLGESDAAKITLRGIYAGVIVRR